MPGKQVKKRSFAVAGKAKSATLEKPTATDSGASASSQTKKRKADVEEDFPRGGSSGLTPLEFREVQKQAEKDLLNEDHSIPTPKTKKKRVSTPAVDDEFDGLSAADKALLGRVGIKSSQTADSLRFKRLFVGMVLVGAVKEINELDLVLSLPGNLAGMVSINDISAAITAQVEQAANADDEDVTDAMANSDDDEEQDNDEEKMETITSKKAAVTLPDLNALFKIGQLLQCTVTAIENTDTRKRVDLSLQPSLVNQGLKPSQLTVGQILTGSVRSLEDRGYTVDVGIDGVTAFLPFKQTDENLVVGQIVVSTIKTVSTEGRGITLAANEQAITTPMIKGEKLGLDALRAGQLVQARIKAIIAKGLHLAFLGVFEGTVDVFHLDFLMEKQADIEAHYKVAQLVTARVLFVDPNSRSISLSLQEHIVNWKPFQFPNKDLLDIGTIVSEGVVKRVDQHHGLGMLLKPTNSPAYVHIARVSDKQIDRLDKKYQPGSVHRSRVIGFDYVDGVVIVSMQKSVLEKPFLTFSDIKAGSVIEGKVVRTGASGIIVQLDDNIRGLVSARQVADVQLRNLAKKFPDGSPITCMVLQVDAKRRHVFLTHKRTLMQSTCKKILTYEDAQVGELAMGYIASIQNFGLIVRFFNNVKGVILKSEMSSVASENMTKAFQLGQSVKCRVVRTNPQKERLRLSLKLTEEFVAQPTPKAKAVTSSSSTSSSSKQPISIGVADDRIHSIEDIVVGMTTKAVVRAIKRDHLIVQITSAIQGRLFATEIVDDINTLPNPQNPFETFQQGAVIDVKVIGFSQRSFQKNKLAITHKSPLAALLIEVSTKPSLLAEQKDYVYQQPTRQTTVAGQILQGIIKKSSSAGLVIGITPTFQANVYPVDVSHDLEILKSIQKHFPVGMLVECQALADKKDGSDAKGNKQRTRPVLLRLVSAGQSQPELDSLQVGTMVTGVVSVVAPGEGLTVQLNTFVFAKICVTELNDTYVDQPTKSFQKGQVIRAVVVNHNVSNGQIDLSLRSSLIAAANANTKKKNKLAKVTIPPPMQDTVVIRSFEDVKDGVIVAGFVRASTDQGCFVTLANHVVARVKIGELTDDYIKDWKPTFPPGKLVRGRVTHVDPLTNQIELSLKQSVINSDSSPQITWDDLAVGQKHDGHVKRIEAFGVFISIANSRISGLCHKSQLSDEPIEDIGRVYSVGDPVRLIILNIEQDKKRLSLGLKQSYFDDEDYSVDVKNTEKEEEEEEEEHAEDDAIKDDDDDNMDGIAFHDDDEIQNDDRDDAMDASINNNKGMGNVLQLVGGFDWNDATLADPSNKTKNGTLEEDESDDDDDTSTDAKLKKKSKREKRREKDTIEAKIVEQENELIASSTTPQTAEDYDRLLLANPNSSFLWIKYMAFQLGLTEIEKARAVAEKALKTISFREEQEKMNVWVALMNLENSYGSTSSLLKIFERAVVYNEPKKIYMHLVKIYERTQKLDAAEDLYGIMVKKFRESSKVWTQYDLFKLRLRKDPEAARKVLDRAIKSLPKRKHIKTICKFAQMEFKFGEVERGRTIFEGIMSNYPKRGDLWSIYVDMEEHHGDIDSTRRLLERIVQLSWSSKKMKFFFKRFLEFEKKHGDEQAVEHVKDLARNYVASVTK